MPVISACHCIAVCSKYSRETLYYTISDFHVSALLRVNGQETQYQNESGVAEDLHVVAGMHTAVRSIRFIAYR